MAEVQTELEQQAEDTMHGKFLVFYLDGQQYAIAISYVVDIINLQPITRVPNCPNYIRGITNLRGKVIPIVDLRSRFGKQPKEVVEGEEDRTCIVVVEQANLSVGIIVDGVAEVISLPDENISTPPSFNGSAEAHFIEGVGRTEDGIYLIINCREVLGEESFSAMDDDDEL